MSKSAPGPPFNDYIKSYDIHTYYNVGHEPSRQEAFELREKLQKDFAKEIAAGELNVYRMWDKAIGPHITAMWECDFKSPELFSRIVPWYQWNHGNLSVLIHPHTERGGLIDHTQHALWLGTKIPLIEDVLKQ
ncbi:uncharacterized protein SAPINGB_P001152 [Magnusiomyces paraingens]|uniref:Dopa 4,5-dioxygenase n=1 Tax=Magnusiomyces paraingens TaxID=2606893 RepID=A0A5E8B4U4_9ASCO|nr:uncharacterized protein SAPINGB_P001152 [Saprochaete ingens]VVT46314.1 unnamed protein product [Saprochaete ingens]